MIHTLFLLEPKIHDDMKWTTNRKGLYMWWIGGQLYSIFFKSPLIMHCTGCSCDSARCSLVARLRWTKCPKLKRIPGKDEKRSIDNLGMPGDFNYWIKMMMKMTTNKDHEALTTARHEPWLMKNPKKWLRKIHGWQVRCFTRIKRKAAKSKAGINKQR